MISRDIRRKFGQNYLSDPAIIFEMGQAISPQTNSNFFEIGPGMGALTNTLNQDGISIKAIDIDQNNIDYLSKHFKGPAKFEFFQGDILSTPLNFLEDKDSQNKNFMLLCGFEKFDNLFVRIDILERLFVQIINATSKENSEIKMIPEMLNLLGCSKENFKKLLQKMGYKTYEKEQEMFFKYNPVKKFKKIQNKKVSNENPFKVLKNLKLG